jgi:hypothetical protein
MLIWPNPRTAFSGTGQIKPRRLLVDFPTGPPVLWLRTGNGATRDLLHLLEPIWPTIEAN